MEIFCRKLRLLRRWFKWGRTKTEVFEYDDVMHHLLILGLITHGLRVFDRVSFLFLRVSIRTGKNDSNTLSVDACDFFDDTDRKNSQFSIL